MKIIWNNEQWIVFFELSNFAKILIVKEILSGENQNKTLSWVAGITTNYSIII